jgi:hypothetical protein
MARFRLSFSTVSHFLMKMSIATNIPDDRREILFVRHRHQRTSSKPRAVLSSPLARVPVPVCVCVCVRVVQEHLNNTFKTLDQQDAVTQRNKIADM